MTTRILSRPDSLVRNLKIGCLSLLFIVPAARGGDMHLRVYSSRIAGMGGVSSALVGEPTAVHMNPAALLSLQGTTLSLGAGVTIPDVTFTPESPGASGVGATNQVLFPPNVSITHSFSHTFGVGVTAGVPFISRIDWGADSPLSHTVTSAELRAIRIIPALAFQLTENLSVGVGATITTLRVGYDRKFAVAGSTGPDAEGLLSYNGDSGPAYGVQAGLLLTPGSVLSLGLSYASAATATVENGTLAYSQIPPDATGSYPPGSFASSLKLPGSFAAALTLQPTSFLLLAAEVQYSSLSPTDSLPFGWMFPGVWDDAVSVRAGMEAQFSEFSLRAGVTFDRSPAPDNGVSPALPTMDAVGFAAGVGYAVDRGLRLDFSYQRFPPRSRSVSAMQHTASGVLTSIPGTYTMSSTVVGLNVTYFWK